MEEPWMIANTVTSEELYDDPLAGDIEETIDRIIEREKSKLQAEFYAETQRVIERMPHLVSVCYISMAPEVREYAPLKAQSAVTEMITEMREATNQGLAELEGVRARLAGAFQAWYDRSGRKPSRATQTASAVSSSFCSGPVRISRQRRTTTGYTWSVK